MSGTRHATISAWQRHEDGSYAAEINGWNLKVMWRPETPAYNAGSGVPAPLTERRGFLWEAEKEGAAKLAAADVSEEIEVAMALAEAAVEGAGKSS